jgi:hypothetical protein
VSRCTWPYTFMVISMALWPTISMTTRGLSSSRTRSSEVAGGQRARSNGIFGRRRPLRSGAEYLGKTRTCDLEIPRSWLGTGSAWCRTVTLSRAETSDSLPGAWPRPRPFPVGKRGMRS